jgi:DNA-binding transcriptional LysR family regulator
MDLRRLRYFVAVAEQLNFRRAARSLGISQPAVTKQISALEAELGLDLFDRDGSRIVARTPAGDNYLADAQRILFELDDAARSAREIAEGKNGRLRLAVGEDATSQILASILATWRSRLPQVDLDLSELADGRLVNALLKHDIDMALVVPPVEEASIMVEPLWEEAWFVALPLAHELAAYDRLTCAELANVGLILAQSRRGPDGHEHIREAFRSAGLSPHVVARPRRRSTMVMLSAAGIGATFVPASMAATSIPGVVTRPFDAAPVIIAAAFRADPPAHAMHFLRIAQETVRAQL